MMPPFLVSLVATTVATTADLRQYSRPDCHCTHGARRRRHLCDNLFGRMGARSTPEDTGPGVWLR